MLDYDDTLVHEDIEADPRAALVRQVVRELRREAGPAQSPIRRITVAVDAVEPLRWLRAQPQAAKFYWADRGHDRIVAAVGTADVLTAPDRCDYAALQAELDVRLNRADAAVRYFGGVRFDHAPEAAHSSEWQPFGAYRFVLPRFELTVAGDETRLTCNLVLPHDAGRAPALRKQIQQLTWPAPRRMSLPAPIGRCDAPERAGWMEMIADALAAIRERALEKVVFARRSTFALAQDLDPFVLLQQLQAATPGCFHYGVQPRAGDAFVGASPERLFRCADGAVWSEAIAGTRSRGDSAQADAALRDELLDSEKDRREHAFVQTAIRERLGALCSHVTLEETASEMRLARGRHLRSRFEGQLRKGTTPIDLLRALHPTPAVGGSPTDPAVDFIRAAEPFDRGWYAGPVGWIGRDAAEFAVALRCGRVNGSQLALYSGAGIVEGSIPAREWDEIEQKISDFAAVLDLNA